ncbi:hypothetical protein A2861_00720 [Candidatus Roizmanbacteria bacterium RIFCSPHIGHO2_01_FULL_38_15]|nr:MAG: hypothetical protein A2861_00720 [Candidatus Roizmanbacteria bacterium RIFCSPHIGHO2_01_FULL_38_15]
MKIKLKKNSKRDYICPFCKNIIKSSSKTEIFYRSVWIDGCYNCFGQSIDKMTTAGFQEKSY